MTLVSLFCLSLLLFVTSAQRTLQLYEDDVCKQDGMWRCKKASECQTLEPLLKSKRGFRPEICNFLGSVVLVCCPPSTGNLGPGPSDSGTRWGSSSPTPRPAAGYRPNMNAQPRPTPTTAWNNRPTTTTSWNRPTTASAWNNRPTTASTWNNRPTSASTWNNRPTPATGWNSRPAPATGYRQQTTTRRPNAAVTTKPPTKAVATPVRSGASGFGTKSKQMCEEYAKAVFRYEAPLVLIGEVTQELEKYDDCGNIEEPLIVGGVDANPKEFPHMALIGYGSEQNIKWLCGGSLISKKHILSAAHCTDTTRGKPQFVRLGDLNIKSTQELSKPITVKIINHSNHPKYNRNTHYNDIAVYELEKEVEFNGYVRPLCLNTEKQVEDRTALATGWGHTEWGGTGSDTLKKVRLSFLNATGCSDTYPRNKWKNLPNGIDQETQFCASEQDKETCQGDSGGPLQIPLTKPYCMYAQVGVISFGKGCSNRFPGVFTRISSFIPWIESVVWPN